MTYFDLQVRYDLTDNMDVYFGIDNLTNKQPPCAQLVTMSQFLELIILLSHMLEFGIVIPLHRSQMAAVK